MPMPAHECSVVPPIFTEAIPVDAVIARVGLPLPPQASIMARSRTDFPVPTKNQPSFRMKKKKNYIGTSGSGEEDTFPSLDHF